MKLSFWPGSVPYNGFVMVIEASNSLADSLVRMVKPSSPSLGGKDNRSRSRSLGGALLVRDGIRFDLSFDLIMSSMGVLMFGMVLAR